MGCLQSNSLKFEPNEVHFGQSTEALSCLTDLIGLDTDDINIMYKAFQDMDSTNSGYVRLEEIMEYFSIENNKLSRYFLDLFDVDKHNDVNFMQFCMTLWYFLTEVDYAEATFAIVDTKITGEVHFKAVYNLVEIMHGINSNRLRSAVDNFVKTLKGDERLTFEAYKAWADNEKSLLQPVIMLQKSLRMRILGENFWSRMTDNRVANPSICGRGFLNVLLEKDRSELARYQRSIDAVKLAEEKNKYVSHKGQRLTMAMKFFKVGENNKVVPGAGGQLAGVDAAALRSAKQNKENVQEKRRRKSILKPSLIKNENEKGGKKEKKGKEVKKAETSSSKKYKTVSDGEN